MKLRSLGAAVLLCLGLAATAQAAGPPTQLTVGDLQRPLNVEGAPQFGWMPAADQTAYQVTVAKGATQVWDSGKVPSSDQAYVPYAGPALATGEAYDWTVKTWDRTDTASPAATGHFETGLTDQGWSGANWIRRITTGNDSTDDWTYARKQFPALSASPVTRARIYASSLGQYDVHVNGELLGRGDNYNHPTEGQYYAFDATDAVQAGRPLTLGALYHYWTCTCQGRANGPASNTTLSAAQAAGATNLKVGAVNVFDPGDQISVGGETTTVTAIGTAGATGTGITVTPALQTAHASGAAVLDFAGPSALIMKAVVDHADGTRETFVTDGTWKVAKAAEFTNATITRRNGDSGDNAERYDARNEQDGWDAAGFDDAAWQPAYAIGPHPRPLNALRESYSHLVPAISQLTYETIHPKSVTKLADGSVVADFGKVSSGVPQLSLRGGVAGRQLVMQTSYRLNNTTLSAAAAAGASTLTVASAANFVAGDRITVDQASNGFGKGDPEARTIQAVSGTTITLDAPLTPRARERALRRRLARRHVHGRHAGLQPRLVVHREDRRADRPPAPVLGLALPADPAARRGGGPQRRRHLRRRPAPVRARGAPGDLRLRQPDARRGLRADAALRDRLLAGDVPGHAHAREGPVHRRHGRHLLRDDGQRGRPQRDRAGDPRDRRLRLALLEGRLQRLLHRRPAPVHVLEPRHARARERRLPQRRQHARHPGLHRVRPRMGLALLPAER